MLESLKLAGLIVLTVASTVLELAFTVSCATCAVILTARLMGEL